MIIKIKIKIIKIRIRIRIPIRIPIIIISTCSYVEQIFKGIPYQTHQEMYYTINLLGAAIEINCQT